MALLAMTNVQMPNEGRNTHAVLSAGPSHLAIPTKYAAVCASLSQIRSPACGLENRAERRRAVIECAQTILAPCLHYFDSDRVDDLDRQLAARRRVQWGDTP